MSAPLVVTVIFKARPGQAKDFGRRLLALVTPTLEEPGCLRFDVHQARDDASSWLLYEHWRSPEALAVHLEMPYVKPFLAALPGLLDGEAELRQFAMASPPDA